MTKEQFKQELSKIKEAPSITGRAYYHSIVLNGKYVNFIRKGKFEVEKINFEELYQLYSDSAPSCPNTNNARDYITGRVYSPAVAILAKIIGC